MTLHAKNYKPGCISFHFINFYSQRGDPPSDAPEGRVDFFSGKEEGYNMPLHAKNGIPGCINFH